MDDHTDLHIFQTQPCSLGSPCLTALVQGASCIIHHLLPCSKSTRLIDTQSVSYASKAHVPVLIHN